MRAPAGIVLIAAVLGLSPGAAQGQSGIRAEIEALNAKLEGWYAAGQIDSVAAIFAEDVWQLPPNAPPVVGRDSAHAYWTGLTRQGRVEFDLVTQDLVAADSSPRPLACRGRRAVPGARLAPLILGRYAAARDCYG